MLLTSSLVCSAADSTIGPEHSYGYRYPAADMVSSILGEGFTEDAVDTKFAAAVAAAVTRRDKSSIHPYAPKQ